jgi:DNA modification methylase
VTGAHIKTQPLEAPSKKLEVSYRRTCNCPANHISCATSKEWIKGMVGIQEFFYEGRDIRDKNVHPAVFPIALPAHFIRLLTHRGELVLDPFVGVGSTLVAARDLGRNAVGFDLQQNYVDICMKRLGQSRLVGDAIQIAIADDAMSIPKYLQEQTVSLSITSPPYPHFLTRRRLNKSIRGDLRENEYYFKIQQYSNDPRDLGLMDHEAYQRALTDIYKGILPLMKPRAHCIVNINDLWESNRRYPTHLYVVNALTEAGFELRNTFIWDKRNLVNRVGIFGWPNNFISLGATFEFILDFWRPPHGK